MIPITQPDAALERARQHVRNVRDFLYHLMVYVLVNAMLVVIDLRTDGANPVLGLDWAYWVIIFWGFGIAGHAISVFYSDYRAERMIAKQQSGDGGEG